MGRERFEDLKEAYALGALSEDERRELEGYLTLHPEPRPEIDELNTIANTLALAPAEYEPSPELRRNLMNIVNSEAREEQPDQTSAWARLRGYLSFRTLAPAALAIITVALLGWNGLLQQEVQSLQGEIQDLQGEVQERQTFAMQGSGAASDVNAEVVRLEGGKAIVVAENMPPTPEDKTMQIWLIQDGTPQPAGTFRPSGDAAAAYITGPLSEADSVAITVEPSGGSPEPTTEPVLQTSIPT